MSITKNLLGAGLFASSLIVAAPASASESTSNTFSTARADGLKVFNYQVGPGATLTFKTLGCDVPNSLGNLPDTIAYLLEATPLPAELITRDVNDDAPGQGLCSKVTVLNTSSTTKSYFVIVAATNDTRVGEISMQAQIGVLPAVISTIYAPQFVGGGRWQRGWNNTPSCSGSGSNKDQLVTVPIRQGIFGGGDRGLADPQLWAIDRVPGHKSFRDLDSGIERHASLSLASRPSCSGSCDILVGATNTAPSLACASGSTSCRKGVAKIWALEQNGCDADSDGLVDAIEVAEGTDPSNLDGDRDGIRDIDEFLGLRGSLSLTGLESGTDNIAYNGANATEQDLFILLDWWASSTASFEPYDTIGDDMNAIFRDDTSFTGRKINVHVLHGVNVLSSFAHRVATIDPECVEGTAVPGTADAATFANIYTTKATRVSSLQIPVYHYGIFVDRGFLRTGASGCVGQALTNPVEGLGETRGNDMLLVRATDPSTDPSANTSGRTNAQLTVLMHELGHNLIPNSTNHFGNGQPKIGPNSCVYASVLNNRYSKASGWGETGGVTLLASDPKPKGLAPEVMRRFGYSNGTCAAVGAVVLEDAGVCGSSTCDASSCESSGSSPRLDCPNGGSCDCDKHGGVSDWQAVTLDFACLNGSGCSVANFGD